MVVLIREASGSLFHETEVLGKKYGREFAFLLREYEGSTDGLSEEYVVCQFLAVKVGVGRTTECSLSEYLLRNSNGVRRGLQHFVWAIRGVKRERIIPSTVNIFLKSIKSLKWFLRSFKPDKIAVRHFWQTW